jgi:uncharacterized membrane protein
VDAGRGWEWIASAFSLFMKQPGIWVLMFIIWLVCFVVLGVIPFLGGIANMLLYPVFAAGFMLACRALDNGEEIEAQHLFAGFREKTGDLVVVGLLALIGTVIALVPALVIAGGAGLFAAAQGGGAALMAMGLTMVLGMLLVVALMIPIYMALWFAAPLVLFHGLKPAEALKASFFANLKNLIPFTVYGIVLLVLLMVAAIPFGLGLLAAVPVLFISVYTSYRDIFFGE